MGLETKKHAPMSHDSSRLFQVMSADEIAKKWCAQEDTDGYWKSNAFVMVAARIGKAIPQREHFPSLSISNISLLFSFLCWVENSGMGKHCPGLCLYPAPALIHIRCLINTGNYRVGRSERPIHTACTLSLPRAEWFECWH